MIRVITVWQPWASLIMIGAKPFEFRPKSYLKYPNPPKVGERVGIHAGARTIKVKEVRDLITHLGWERDGVPCTPSGLNHELALPLLEKCAAAFKCQGLPLGVILGTVELGKPRNASTLFAALPQDSDRGEFNWAWPCNKPQWCEPPVERRGQQGFWNTTLL